MEHVYSWNDLKGWNMRNGLNNYTNIGPTKQLKGGNGLNNHTNIGPTKENIVERWREQFTEEEEETDIKEPTVFGKRNVGGRPKKYTNTKEATIARNKQTAESHKRIRQNLAKIKAQQSPQQQQLVKYLQEHVVDDINLLELIYNRLKSRLGLWNDTPVVKKY
jgi:hypothetical protein